LNKINNYEAYLFDLDGTLVPSEKLKGQALSKACEYFGRKVSIDFYKDVMGESWEIVRAYFFKKGNFSPNKEEFDNVFKKIYQELIQKELVFQNDVKIFLDKLIKENKKLALVSSASSWMVKQILQKFDLVNYFKTIVTKEDVKNHKPDPEAYTLAIKRLALLPGQVLIFEDSNAGITAAKNAGCDAIAINHEFNVKHDFSIADKVISNFNEIIF